MHHDDVPEGDPRHDITDLYAFQMPDNPASSILILNVHPDASISANAVDPQASYELKIDTNGDFQADLAFHVLFGVNDRGEHTATVYRSTGADAHNSGSVGEVIFQHTPVSVGREVQITSADGYHFFAGLRSDPFFADRLGFANNMQWTGQDYFADKNVFGIVLEVPHSAFGTNPQLGIWARVMAPVHGITKPANVAGRPGNNVFRPDVATFQTIPPAQQRDLFLPHYVGIFQNFGYSEPEASVLAREWLPDVLRYDYTQAAGYPNGRHLTDRVVEDLIRIITRGAITTGDQIGPHNDLLAEFPYLGSPH
jgi:hypothetical protein